MNSITNKKKVVVFLLILAMSFIVFYWLNQKDIISYKGQAGKTLAISIGQKQITALVADTVELQKKGLSGRESIYPYDAMLFIFSVSAKHGIWMKDMRFPIDIFWLKEAQIDADNETLMNADRETPIDADREKSLTIVDIKEGALPSSFPEVFTPNLPSKYVLEAPAGFVEENNLKIRDKISFTNI